MGPRLPLVEVASRLAVVLTPHQRSRCGRRARTCIWHSSDRLEAETSLEGLRVLTTLGDLEAEASLEGLHVLTRVRSDRQRVETRHDAALRDGEAAEEAEHRRTPVVELDEQPSRLLLGRLVLGEAEGVEIVQGHRVRNRLLERREVTRLASCAGVVEVAGSEPRAERAS